MHACALTPTTGVPLGNVATLLESLSPSMSATTSSSGDRPRHVWTAVPRILGVDGSGVTLPQRPWKASDKQLNRRGTFGVRVGEQTFSQVFQLVRSGPGAHVLPVLTRGHDHE